jgi:raffinose/stachyose/melibiose transport system permease protein
MTVTDRTSVAPTRSSKRSAGSKQNGSAGGYRLQFGYWWWAVPAVVLVVVAIYLATAAGAWYAFTDYSGIGGWNFVGLANFKEIFRTPELTGSLVNTLVLAFGYVVLTNVIGLGFALALNRGLKTRYLLRTLVFMPVVIAPIAVSYVWKFIFAYDGPLNATLELIGLKGLQQDWLADPHLGLAAILVVMVWQSIGFAMVIYLAGLATVPVELEEAAALDGAGTVRRLFSLTLPMIQPSVAIATTLSLVQGLRVFDQVLALTGGGPADATQTLATQVYQQTFVFGKFGFGAALALILTLIILVFTVVQQYLTRDRL